mmetsp:Transcript_563/g.785  ORF Transcript_563/g.785 Transcript_563/m.785 type:complete len:379 (-) Transcript_563:147-1283(-)
MTFSSSFPSVLTNTNTRHPSWWLDQLEEEERKGKDQLLKTNGNVLLQQEHQETRYHQQKRSIDMTVSDTVTNNENRRNHFLCALRKEERRLLASYRNMHDILHSFPVDRSEQSPGLSSNIFSSPHQRNTSHSLNCNTLSIQDFEVITPCKKRCIRKTEKQTSFNGDMMKSAYHDTYNDSISSNIPSMPPLAPTRRIIDSTMTSVEDTGLGAEADSSPFKMLPLPTNKMVSSNRPFLPLGVERDEQRISKFLCFLRAECIEVFEACETDLFKKKKNLKLGRVGIRCRFCAYLPVECRSIRSCSFPSSISGIYQCVSNMIYKHFPTCDHIPKETMDTYKELKKSTKKGDSESKSYWIESAKELGMIDKVDDKIIVLLRRE